MIKSLNGTTEHVIVYFPFVHIVVMASHSSEKQELIREVSQILEAQPYASISSPTERAVIYSLDQQKDSLLS